MTAPRLLTPRQVADQLGYSTAQIYRWINGGQLPAIRADSTGPWRVREDDLATWVSTAWHSNQDINRPRSRRHMRAVGT